MDQNEIARADLIALRSMLVALVATHPDKDGLRRSFDLQTQQTQASLEANPVREDFLQEVLKRHHSLRHLVAE